MIHLCRHPLYLPLGTYHIAGTEDWRKERVYLGVYGKEILRAMGSHSVGTEGMMLQQDTVKGAKVSPPPHTPSAHWNHNSVE